jgi:hypothetical protein
MRLSFRELFSGSWTISGVDRLIRRRMMSNDGRGIPVLNPGVVLPEFAFFQVVKVKTTKEVGTVVGMWHLRTDSQSQQWLYRWSGLRTKETIWWEGEQLRTMQRRSIMALAGGYFRLGLSFVRLERCVSC